jgi:hypothetical protein
MDKKLQLKISVIKEETEENNPLDSSSEHEI